MKQPQQQLIGCSEMSCAAGDGVGVFSRAEKAGVKIGVKQSEFSEVEVSGAEKLLLFAG